MANEMLSSDLPQTFTHPQGRNVCRMIMQNEPVCTRRMLQSLSSSVSKFRYKTVMRIPGVALDSTMHRRKHIAGALDRHFLTRKGGLPSSNSSQDQRGCLPSHQQSIESCQSGGQGLDLLRQKVVTAVLCLMLLSIYVQQHSADAGLLQ